MTERPWKNAEKRAWARERRGLRGGRGIAGRRDCQYDAMRVNGGFKQLRSSCGNQLRHQMAVSRTVKCRKQRYEGYNTGLCISSRFR